MIYVFLEGRLGNLLYEIAAAATLSERLQVPYCAVVNKNYHCTEPDNCSLTEYIKPYKETIFRNIPFAEDIPADAVWTPYDGMDLNTITSVPATGLVIYGTYQDIRFFPDSLLQRLFAPSAERIVIIEETFSILRVESVTCSIVVRRGDYLRLPMTNPAEDYAYYHKCMRTLEKMLHTKDIHYVVISDDTDWCQKHFKGENITIVPHIDPLTDLYVAALCKHNIISNSSFAQWGAHLNTNPNKVVLYPNPWFGKAMWRHEKENIGRMVPSTWIPVHHYSRAYLYGCLLYLIKGTSKHLKKLTTLFKCRA